MEPTRRILIVEDEPNVRLVFRTALESDEYTLTTAPDGETALRLAEARAVRPRPARPPDARDGRHGAAPAAPRRGHRRPGGHRQRPRRRAERRPGDEAGGHRLPRQAGDARGAPPRVSEVLARHPRHCGARPHPRQPARRHPGTGQARPEPAQVRPRPSRRSAEPIAAGQHLAEAHYLLGVSSTRCSDERDAAYAAYRAALQADPRLRAGEAAPYEVFS